MKKNSFHCQRKSLVLFLLLILVAKLFAQPGDGLKHTAIADPISIWDYDSNPAMWGYFQDVFSGGIKLSGPASSIFAGNDFNGQIKALFSFGGLAYSLEQNIQEASVDQYLSTAARLGPLSLGVRFSWDGDARADYDGLAIDTGLALRLWNFLSIAGMYRSGLSPVFYTDSMGFSLSAALRPFAFNKKLESLLSLSADALISDGSFALHSLGARFAMDPWLGLGAFYYPKNSGFGLSLSLQLSGMETVSAYSGSLSSPADGTFSLGMGYRMGRQAQKSQTALSKSMLIIESPGTYSSVPPLFNNDFGGLSGETPIWFEEALDAIKQAAFDNSIKCIALVNPPIFDSDARAQDFARALLAFKATGKAVYVYSRSMDRLNYVYSASMADLIALDPNGSLLLMDASSFYLYFKGLFDKLGIATYNLRSHDTKTAYNMFTEENMTRAERVMGERYIFGLAEQSYDMLDKNRAGKLANLAKESIASGPYLTPVSALEAGLVDSILYKEDFFKEIENRHGKLNKKDIRGYAREKGLSWGEAPGKNIAIVYLSGSIIEGPGIAGSSIGDRATELLALLREDKSIAGVILRVDSGGGSALTSDHIARELRLLKEAGKPVIASMASYAASGGYYISALADKIFLEEATITGSIGVTGLSFNLTGLLEKLGIGAATISASASGDFNNPFLPYNIDDAEKLEDMIGFVYERFINVVAEGRKLDAKRVDELGKGQVWIGAEAIENGLADEIGGLDSAKAAMAKLVGARVNYRTFVPGDLQQNLLFTLLNMSLGAKSGASAPKLLPGAEKIDALFKSIAEMGSGPLYLEPSYLLKENFLEGK